MKRNRYKIGSKCETGQVIASLLGQSDSVTVYTTQDNHLRWTYFRNKGKLTADLRRVILEFDELMATIASTIVNKRSKTAAYHLLGKCLFSILDSGQAENAQETFKPVRNLIAINLKRGSVNKSRSIVVKKNKLLSGEPRRDRGQMRKPAATVAIRVAFSYSHKDEELRDQLETHLKFLLRQGVISAWHDRKIIAGENWAGLIDDNFKRADLILLLVSADYVASDYCYQTEMKMALEREKKSEARVVPVILRACEWQGAPFGKLLGLPKDMKPITSWANRDEAWTDVAGGIRKIAETLRQP